MPNIRLCAFHFLICINFCWCVFIFLFRRCLGMKLFCFNAYTFLFVACFFDVDWSTNQKMERKKCNFVFVCFFCYFPVGWFKANVYLSLVMLWCCSAFACKLQRNAKTQTNTLTQSPSNYKCSVFFIFCNEKFISIPILVLNELQMLNKSARCFSAFRISMCLCCARIWMLLRRKKWLCWIMNRMLRNIVGSSIL